ncbi:MAG TPA: hypothetical protein VJQ52_23035 [Steroidobacteraceae bacterium]|nr:hypothetical protein [Steroidobacteraceae bacterium]
MIRRTLPFFCLLALGGCADSLETTLGAPVQLAPGQSAVIEDEELEVRFVGVASDSRCPSDVACLWTGEVVVQLAARKAGRTTQHEVREAQSARVGDHTVTVLQVLPPRASSQQTIARADYRVTLKVAR